MLLKYSFPGRPSAELDDLARVTLLSNQAGGVMSWGALGQWRGGTCNGQKCGPQLPWLAGAPRPGSPSCLPDVNVGASARMQFGSKTETEAQFVP